MQRPAIGASADLIVGIPRRLPRIIGQHHMIGIDRGVDRRDAVEAVIGQLDRGERAGPNRRRRFGYARQIGAHSRVPSGGPGT